MHLREAESHRDTWRTTLSLFERRNETRIRIASGALNLLPYQLSLAQASSDSFPSCLAPHVFTLTLLLSDPSHRQRLPKFSVVWRPSKLQRYFVQCCALGPGRYPPLPILLLVPVGRISGLGG